MGLCFTIFQLIRFGFQNFAQIMSEHRRHSCKGLWTPKGKFNRIITIQREHTIVSLLTQDLVA